MGPPRLVLVDTCEKCIGAGSRYGSEARNLNMCPLRPCLAFPLWIQTAKG